MGFIEFIMSNLWILILSIAVIMLSFYLVRLYKMVDYIEQQNAIEHTKLYKNQKTIASELSQILTVVRSLKDDIRNNNQLLRKKIDDYTDSNKIIKKLKDNLENESKKVEKTERLVLILTEKIKGLKSSNIDS